MCCLCLLHVTILYRKKKLVNLIINRSVDLAVDKPCPGKWRESYEEREYDENHLIMQLR